MGHGDGLSYCRALLDACGSVVRGVERDVLVQLFQRRVLSYTPGNPAGFEVEMGNVGQHYYAWRYGSTPWVP